MLRHAITPHRFALAVAIALTLAAGVASRAATPTPRRAEATFAGGCFWCVETAFEGQPGVLSVTSGYTGGAERNPTYEDVGHGRTGHAEAVRIVYDPARTNYARLLDTFWRNIDPTQADGQFCDRGKQYRSAIYTHDATQRRLALDSKRRVAAKLRRAIVTEIAPAGPFYPAEDYHQDYYRKNPVEYRAYRTGCGRDRRLAQLWGKAPPQAH